MDKRDFHLLGATFLLVFIVGFALNMIWEWLHYPLYITAIPRWWMIVASFVDAIIIVGLYIAVALLYRDGFWLRKFTSGRIIVLSLCGFLVAYLIEVNALVKGTWNYGPSMPMIAGLGVGLSPLLQMIITPALAIFVTSRILRLTKRLPIRMK